MNPAVAGALIGSISTATVSVVTQVLSHKREGQQLRRTERRELNETVRAVLDETLAVAHQIRGDIADYVDDVAEYEQSLDPEDRVASARHDVFIEQHRRMRLLLSQLEIRLGPDSPVTNAFGKMLVELHTYSNIASAAHTNALLAESGQSEAREHADVYNAKHAGEHEERAEKAIDAFARRAHEWATQQL